MPQVFSTGWLYLFLFIMFLCVFRILMKLRDIHGEPDMNKPVIKLAPVSKDSPHLDDGEKEDDILAEPDRLIREGHYADAVNVLASMVQSLSPVEDREAMGKIQYRIGACHRRIGLHEKNPASFLRSGDALREAVGLFSPERLWSLQLRALSELAGLYEDLAGYQNPVENLNRASRTWKSAVSIAKKLNLPYQEAVFHSRSGSALKELASHADRRQNLQEAIDLYETAVSITDAFTDPDSLFEKAVILKTLGDLRVELSVLKNSLENMGRAVSAFEGALRNISPEKHPAERGVTLLDMGQLLLDLYDAEQSPAHLRKALRCLKEAVDLVKTGDDRARKGFAMALLGDALVRYSEVKDPKENLGTAVRLYETALGFLKEPEYASHRDRIKEGLRKAVEKMNSVVSNK
jgi:tetratricopeptide (TPR) repeat protein